MARFYTNENIPLPLVVELRRMGHDVLTSMDAGWANSSVPDVEVLAFAISERRILITHNRRHFLNLHRQILARNMNQVLEYRERHSFRHIHDSAARRIPPTAYSS